MPSEKKFGFVSWRGAGAAFGEAISDNASRQKETRAGFTLVELLVVIAIIGLLSTIVVVGTNYARENARDARRVADIDTIRKALEIYINTNSRYPSIAADTCLTNSDAISTALKNAAAISQVPVDPLPAWASDAAHCFLYKASDGSTFSIRYELEINSKAGSAGQHWVSP
jgi:general secretion pathway protein G